MGRRNQMTPFDGQHLFCGLGMAYGGRGAWGYFTTSASATPKTCSARPITRAGSKSMVSWGVSRQIPLPGTSTQVENNRWLRIVLTARLTAFEAECSDLDVIRVDVNLPGQLAEHLVDLSESTPQEHIDAQRPALNGNDTFDGRLVALPLVRPNALPSDRASSLRISCTRFVPCPEWLDAAHRRSGHQST